MNRTRFYKLDDKNNVVPGELSDITEARRILKKSYINVLGVKCEVSTVFMSMDHGFSDMGPPVVFETMIFGGVFDQYQERYCTWDEAETGHANAVEMIQDKRKIARTCVAWLRDRFSSKWWSFKYFISRKIVSRKRKKENEKETQT